MSTELELKERELMSKGLYYDDAYIQAIKITDSLRKSNFILINNKQLNIPSVLFRDTGTAKEKKAS